MGIDYVFEHYDAAGNEISLDLTITNIGHTPLRVPIYFEVQQIGSQIDRVEAKNADNGLTGVGAVWDLTANQDARTLMPGARSRPVRLIFSVKNVKPNVVVDEALVAVGGRILAQRVVDLK